MKTSTSRVTSQNQISVPARVRQRFGIAPGTELVWEERNGELVVRTKRWTLDDVRAYCAHLKAPKLSLSQMRRARDRAIAAKYGRR